MLVSNALVYHDVSLAPRDRLAELDELGERTAGEGPLLYTEFEEFAKHFLRDADPVGRHRGPRGPGADAAHARRRAPRLRHPADVNTLEPDGRQPLRLVVLRRGPDGQRPPAGWRRTGRALLRALAPRAGARDPRPRRARRSRAAQTCGGSPAGRGRRRVAGRGARARRATLRPGRASRCRSAGPPCRTAPAPVQTVGPGEVGGPLRVPRAGDYEVWLAGSFGRPVEVWIDGRELGAVSDELVQPANWIELGARALDAGRHRVELVRGGGNLAPGNGDGRRARPAGCGGRSLRPSELPPSAGAPCAGARSLRPKRSGRVAESMRLLAGDRTVWLVGGAVLAVMLVAMLSALLQPGERFTGSNSVGVRSEVAVVRAGRAALHTRGLDVPDGTARVRFAAHWQRPIRARARHRGCDELEACTAGGSGRRRSPTPALVTIADRRGHSPIVASDETATGTSLRDASGAAAQPSAARRRARPIERAATSRASRSTRRVAVWFLPARRTTEPALAARPTLSSARRCSGRASSSPGGTSGCCWSSAAACGWPRFGCSRRAARAGPTRGARPRSVVGDRRPRQRRRLGADHALPGRDPTSPTTSPSPRPSPSAADPREADVAKRRRSPPRRSSRSTRPAPTRRSA